jgi:hypothetical protein
MKCQEQWWVAEPCVIMDSTSASYFGGSGFKSQSGDGLFSSFLSAYTGIRKIT